MSKRPGNINIAKLPWLTCAIGAVVLLIQFVLPEGAIALQMDRHSVLQGAIWQMITGHLTHWNNEHLWADLAVFAGIGSLIEQKSRLSLAMLFLVSAVAIALTVFLARPDIQTYRGLSGIDMALAAFWAIHALFQARNTSNHLEIGIWALALIGILSKPVIEIILGHPIFVQDLGSGVVGMPVPHIVGAIIGIAWYLISNHRPQPRHIDDQHTPY